jgi:hypothetical protein
MYMAWVLAKMARAHRQIVKIVWGVVVNRPRQRRRIIRNKRCRHKATALRAVVVDRIISRTINIRIRARLATCGAIADTRSDAREQHLGR